MSVREIIVGDSPVLRQPCGKVERFDEQLDALLSDLWDTMRAAGGVGLAAPQIGVPLRVAVADTGNARWELINPEIIGQEGEQESPEACLSIPGILLTIKRPSELRVKCQDRHGQDVVFNVSGWPARVICHEMDHLNGVLVPDRLAEEELWQQLAAQLLQEAALAETADIRGAPADDPDWRAALDLAADAAWKLTLAAELLQDWNPRGQLTEVIAALQQASELANAALEDLEEPSPAADPAQPE